ncbi:unnamed protein product, partial [Meganyctiphanes norvegica]
MLLVYTNIFLISILCHGSMQRIANFNPITRYTQCGRFLVTFGLMPFGLYIFQFCKSPSKCCRCLRMQPLKGFSVRALADLIWFLSIRGRLKLHLSYTNLIKKRYNDPFFKKCSKYLNFSRLICNLMFFAVRQKGILHRGTFIVLSAVRSFYDEVEMKITIGTNVDFITFKFTNRLFSLDLIIYANNSIISSNTAEYSLTIHQDISKINQFNQLILNFHYPHYRVLGGSRSYSVLVVELYLDRQWGYYFIQYYVTSFILVFISWISLWLDQAAAPARVTLGTSTLLTFVTLSSNSKAVLPKVSVITVIDSWYFICMLFIVATLLEYALVNITYRRQSVVHMKKPAAKYIMKSALTSEAPTPRRLSVASFSQASFTNPNYDYNEMNQRSVMSLPDLEKYQSNNLTVAMGSRDITNLKDMKNEQFLQANKLPKDKIEVAQINSQIEVKLNELKDDTSDNNSFNYDPDDEQDANNKEKDTISDSIPEVKVTVPTLGRFEKPFYEMTYPEIAQWIDTRSRILFPLLFLLINTIYWIAIIIFTNIW